MKNQAIIVAIWLGSAPACNQVSIESNHDRDTEVTTGIAEEEELHVLPPAGAGLVESTGADEIDFCGKTAAPSSLAIVGPGDPNDAAAPGFGCGERTLGPGDTTACSWKSGGLGLCTRGSWCQNENHFCGGGPPVCRTKCVMGPYQDVQCACKCVSW